MLLTSKRPESDFNRMPLESPIFLRPNLNDKRKTLIRSTGSFSVIEDIVVPTPTRKVLNIGCSPKFGRKEPFLEKSLFGEAGFELQNILFSQITSPVPSATSQVLINNEEQPKVVSPLRSSNPITLNSPFHPDERINADQPARLYPSNGRLRNGNSKRELSHRGRSLSWPGVPKISTKKAEK